MRVFLTGVACVGKTTIGEELAALLGYPFFDLDTEIEGYFGTSIERLQNRYLTMCSFRKEASKALQHLLAREQSTDWVIALPPSGLMDSYWRVVKRTNAVIVALTDSPQNILKRITFYDIDSHPVAKNLSEKERRLYLREIKGDISHFRRTYERAALTVDIAGLGPEGAARRVRDALLGGEGKREEQE